MNWSREISSTEIYFILAFLVIYALYIFRTDRIAKSLNSSYNIIYVKLILRTAYFGLLIIALLGPNFGLSETEARVVGKEIYLAFDLSNSMNANDVEPTRLEKAKKEIVSVLDQFKSDKQGLIVFNSNSAVVVPLTFDYELVKSNISVLKTNLLASGTTDFNELFKQLNSKFDSSFDSGNNKIGVVVTDGENFEKINSELLKKAKSLKISLFFVTVGTSAGGKIPVNGGFKHDINGKEIITTLDLNQINAIAKVVGGQYFVLNNEKNQLGELTEQIKKIKSNAEDKERKLVTYNKFIYFLLLALVFISIDFLFNFKIFKI